MDAFDVAEKSVSIIAGIVGAVAAVVSVRAARRSTSGPESQPPIQDQLPFGVPEKPLPAGISLARSALKRSALPLGVTCVWSVSHQIDRRQFLDDTSIQLGVLLLMLLLSLWLAARMAAASRLARIATWILAPPAFALGAINVYFALIEFTELDDRDGSTFLAVVQSVISVSYTVLLAAVMVGLTRPTNGFFKS